LARFHIELQAFRYPSAKSFRRDILEGYLFSQLNQFIDLGEKREFSRYLPMPIHPNVRRCTHIKVTGHRCGSPALKQEYFCYFHTRMIKGVQTRVDSQIHPVALIENAEAIQCALMHTIDAVLKGTIDTKRANLVLKALNIAVRNSRNVYFHISQDDMVREVPNYAQQYLTEHPEQTQPYPRLT